MKRLDRGSSGHAYGDAGSRGRYTSHVTGLSKRQTQTFTRSHGGGLDETVG